ncbi:arginine deiminase family protein [Clostridium sp. DSM 100503]|uniref:dimethylarginine dimethylaminohydrolase family protein n=1 Tax=Clostridium sp. DSM 100503 TaxID=2963282 RepID=UPI00214A5A5B|nr:arginine deiminase family protein [Clostridium sp. DSM 100503]MCR1951641.1 arginine deiminase family protein [Clostridium sp. DSM 100503]
MKVQNYCQSDNLKSCILCYPVNFKIIDKSSEYYNKVNYDLLYSQYNNFINSMSKNNINLYFIDINKNATQQVFTQDIGFIIDDIMFVSKMRNEDRKIETENFMNFIKGNNIKYYAMKNNIEGGDVIKYQDVIFVGMSSRTTIQAVNELQEALISMGNKAKVIPINFDNSKIHLDCVFNTLDKGSAVISPYVYDKKIIEKYINNLYEISKRDADDLGTNYVYLGNKKLLSSNKSVTEMLKEKGYEVEFIEYSEIMKSEGSLGCSCMFSLRK